MLTAAQLEDLAHLNSVARQFGAGMAMIGAAALLCFVDLGRFTRDVDIVVALDLEDFAAFSGVLQTRGWRRTQGREQRWLGPKGPSSTCCRPGQSYARQSESSDRRASSP
jgi:hypothetical protein